MSVSDNAQSTVVDTNSTGGHKHRAIDHQRVRVRCDAPSYRQAAGVDRHAATQRIVGVANDQAAVVHVHVARTVHVEHISVQVVHIQRAEVSAGDVEGLEAQHGGVEVGVGGLHAEHLAGGHLALRGRGDGLLVGGAIGAAELGEAVAHARGEVADASVRTGGIL